MSILIQMYQRQDWDPNVSDPKILGFFNLKSINFISCWWCFISLVTICIIIAHFLKWFYLDFFVSLGYLNGIILYKIRGMDLLVIPIKDSFVYWKQNVGSLSDHVAKNHSNPGSFNIWLSLKNLPGSGRRDVNNFSYLTLKQKIHKEMMERNEDVNRKCGKFLLL